MKPQFPISLFFILLVPGLGSAYAQALDFEAFRLQVLQNHPLARQADLYRDQAQASMLRARGGFDPKVYVAHEGKQFNGKTYFQYSEAGLKLPTWAGLELKGAYNLAAGNFLNTESKLPKDGQASLGLQWSLGQGFLFDERRAGLKLARIGLDIGDAERQSARNDLLLDGAKAYWTWNFAENAVGIVKDAFQQALIRHEGIRQGFLQGERSAMDTLESYIQLQSRQTDLQFAQVDAQNASLALTAYLWQSDGQAYRSENLPEAPNLLLVLPGSEALPEAESLLETARVRHPDLRLYSLKINQLTTELRLKNEKRKPVLDLRYTLLGDSWQFFPTATASGPAVLANDIKWGLDFSYPILNRKARGDWQVTQIKIAQTGFEQTQKRQSVELKLRQYANELQNLSGQATLFREMSANYRKLLDAENERFLQGESSIFMLNTREQRWLDAQLKYLKLLSEYQKTLAGLRWSEGILGE